MSSVNSKKKSSKTILPQDVIEKLKQAEKEIERGEGISADIFFKELRQKYGY